MQHYKGCEFNFDKNVKQQKVNSQDFNIKIYKSQSCPTLNLKDNQEHDIENDITVQIMKIAIEGCESAEKFSLKNQGRFCIKNLHKLCAKTKEQIKKTDKSNTRYQDKEWILKNYILAFARVSEGWKGLENLLLDQHDEYKSIEDKFYEPGIRETFYELQHCTLNVLNCLNDGFQSLHESMKHDLKANLVTNKNEVLPCVSTPKTRVRYEETVSVSPIPHILPDKTEISKTNYYQNYLVDYKILYENTYDIKHNENFKEPTIDVQRLSPDIKNLKKKCTKRDITKAGFILSKYLKEELCNRISNRRMKEIITAHRPTWKNPIVLDDIKKKLKKYSYNDVNDLLKDFERVFYSMLDHFKVHPDELLENIIINVRENFWILAREKLLITD